MAGDGATAVNARPGYNGPGRAITSEDVLSRLPVLSPNPPPSFTRPDLTSGDYWIEAGKATGKAAAVVAVIAGVLRYVPHPLAKGVSILMTGIAYDRTTGRWEISPGAALNPAPAPVGYMEPGVFGLRPDWWLPPGASAFLPEGLDRIGLGLPEARQWDRQYMLGELQRVFAADFATRVDLARRQSSQELLEEIQSQLRFGDNALSPGQDYSLQVALQMGEDVRRAAAIVVLSERGYNVASTGVVPGLYGWTQAALAAFRERGPAEPMARRLDAQFWPDP